MASQCSKSTKTNDWSQSRIQALCWSRWHRYQRYWNSITLGKKNCPLNRSSPLWKLLLNCWAMLLPRCPPPWDAHECCRSTQRPRGVGAAVRKKFIEATPALFGQDFPKGCLRTPGPGGDCKSRRERDRSDWMLAPQVFQKINSILGSLEIDLFASRLTHQLPQFFNPQAAAVDTFQQDWSQLKGYANPHGAWWSRF